jgi:AcrR family transcriptional regulator
MADIAKPTVRNAQDTKARIIEAAQQVFSEKGYSDAGLREIARRANVAGSLVIKYFSTKANLFEEALTKALIDPKIFQEDRSNFGDFLVETLQNPNLRMVQPAMIALSIGDDEAKDIIARVSQEYVLKPMAGWLGTPDAKARASYILMLTMGYIMFARHIAMDDSAASRRETAALVAKGLQEIVDDARSA